MPAIKITPEKNEGYCNLCPLSKYQYSVVQNRGKMPCDLLIIGDIPSASDDLSGLVLSGNEWRLLYYMLEKSGLSKVNYYITNVLRCRPTDSKGGSMRDPTLAEIATCKTRVMRIIERSQAKVYLLMGEIAKKHYGKILPGYFYIQPISTILLTGGTRSPFYLQNLRKLEDIQDAHKTVFKN